MALPQSIGPLFRKWTLTISAFIGECGDLYPRDCYLLCQNMVSAFRMLPHPERSICISVSLYAGQALEDSQPNSALIRNNRNRIDRSAMDFLEIHVNYTNTWLLSLIRPRAVCSVRITFPRSIRLLMQRKQQTYFSIGRLK